MGAQIAIPPFFVISDATEVRLQYQFAAMRRIQMTRRSGQLREPPKFFGFGFTAFRFGVSRKELTFITRKCRATTVLVIVL